MIKVVPEIGAFRARVWRGPYIPVHESLDSVGTPLIPLRDADERFGFSVRDRLVSVHTSFRKK